MAFECVDCCNVFDVPRKPARCSECGSRHLIAQDVRDNERALGDDDGVEYADPRDERDERLAR